MNARLKMMLTARLQPISIFVSFCLSFYSLIENLPLSQSSKGHPIFILRRRCRNLFKKFSLLENASEVKILTKRVVRNCAAVRMKNRPKVHFRVSPVYSVY